MTMHLLQGQSLIIIICIEDQAPDVGFIRPFLEPPIDPIRRVLEMIILHLLDRLWFYRLEKIIEDRIVLDDLGNRDNFDGVEHRLNPFRVRVALEQTKRFSKSKVTHDVEGGELVHFNHVHCLTKDGRFAQD